jgi:hypothetical protein
MASSDHILVHVRLDVLDDLDSTGDDEGEVPTPLTKLRTPGSLPIHKNVLRGQIQIQLESELYNLLHNIQFVEMAPQLCALRNGISAGFNERSV